MAAAAGLALVISLLFVFAQYGAVWIVMRTADIKHRYMGQTAVLEYRLASRRHPVQFREDSVAVAGLAFAGQLAITCGLLAAYALAAGRLGVHRRTLRRLGGYATVTIPLMVIPPMFALVAWQTVNVCVVVSAHLFTIPSLVDRFGRHASYVDLVQLAGFLALVLSSSVSGIVFYRSHREAIRAAVKALGGVRRVGGPHGCA